MRCAFFLFLSIPAIHPIVSVGQFVEFIQDVDGRSKVSLVYRGHSKTSYELKPSLFRDKNHLRSEAEMMRRIFASQPDAFAQDYTTLEKLVRFQHFGLPTRLMDVTWNPLVALYFCVKDSPETDGQVIIIACAPEKTKYFDSDTISCLANLAYLKGSERNVLRRNKELPLEKFNGLAQTKRLVSFVKSEKSYFQNIVNPGDLNRSVLVRPKQSNRRIVAQNGAFVLFGLNQVLVGPASPQSFEVVKLTVDKDSKEPILRQLEKFGFNDEAMFPELESAAKYVKEQFKTR